MGNVLVAAGSGAELWHEVRGPGEVLAPGAPVKRVQEVLRFNAPDPRMLGRRETVLLGVFALLLHAGGLYWLGQRSTPPLPEVPVQIPPMTIEFASPAPPRVEPVPPAPAPLPEPPAPPAVEELA
ncbi:energy transducer TonB, partial [Azotobacter beijerinckii]|nr:energy transducer TonB [Azotobacter beijerinckii]